MIKRRQTKRVTVGNITIGGDAPVSIQSMTNTFTGDTVATLRQIREIHDSGGDLVRVAVPDEEAVNALALITSQSPLPVIADIHFRHDLALRALDTGVSKLRINPGNIGGIENLLKIAKKAKELNIPLRVGVNSGSLSGEIRKRFGDAGPEALAESAIEFIRALEKIDFKGIVISLKASNVVTTVQAYRLAAQKVPYPFHIGITEAGPLLRGTVKSAVGIGALLWEGLGDTIRVSLTADPVKEIEVAGYILQSLGLRFAGPDLVSCPTCGRSEFNVIEAAEEVEKMLKGVKKPLKIAVMGCVVNGPGEAREADLGITGTPRLGFIFKHGEIIRKVHPDELLSAFRQELAQLL